MLKLRRGSTGVGARDKADALRNAKCVARGAAMFVGPDDFDRVIRRHLGCPVRVRHSAPPPCTVGGAWVGGRKIAARALSLSMQEPAGAVRMQRNTKFSDEHEDAFLDPIRYGYTQQHCLPSAEQLIKRQHTPWGVDNPQHTEPSTRAESNRNTNIVMFMLCYEQEHATDSRVQTHGNPLMMKTYSFITSSGSRI